MEDYLLLEMPAFKPHYKKWKKYGYKNVTEKNNLKDTLEESTGGFCMYCYARIRVDKKLYADLEHAIEKSNSDKLIECIPNIGLACSVCNQSFKRIGEKKRKIEKNTIRQFEKTSRCSAECRKQCTVACKALRELQKEYSAGPDAEILLQPMGIRGSDSKEMLALQYNVMKMEYEPAENRHTYSDSELRFIKAHIKRFHLNDPEFRSRQLFDFVRNVIDHNGKMPEYEYNNLTVMLFCEKLKGKPPEEILKICKNIFMIAFLKM